MDIKERWFHWPAGLALCLLGVANADAALVAGSWGVNAETSTADCPGSCTNFEFGPSQGYDGGMGLTTASSSYGDARGDASAWASLSGPAGTAVLKAIAESFPTDGGAFARAVGIQQFEFTGSAGQLLSLQVDMTGSLSIPADTSSVTFESEGSLAAQVGVFAAADFVYTEFYGNFFEYPVSWLQQPDGTTAEVSLSADTDGPVAETATLQFWVDPGDQFVVWSELSAEAQSRTVDVVADAFNTLDMAFDDPSNVVPAAVVPLPAAVWLFASACLALLGLSRGRAPLFHLRRGT